VPAAVAAAVAEVLAVDASSVGRSAWRLTMAAAMLQAVVDELAL